MNFTPFSENSFSAMKIFIPRFEIAADLRYNNCNLYKGVFGNGSN
jgi:hypothetical protein